VGAIGLVGLVIFLLQNLAGGIAYDYVTPDAHVWTRVASVMAFVSVACIVILAHTHGGYIASCGLPSLGLPLLLFAMSTTHGQMAFVLLAVVFCAVFSVITAAVAQIYGDKEHFGILFLVSMPVIGYPVGGAVIIYRWINRKTQK